MTEQFLADILGGRAEPIGKDFRGSDFILNGEKDPSADEALIIIQDHIKMRNQNQAALNKIEQP